MGERGEWETAQRGAWSVERGVVKDEGDGWKCFSAVQSSRGVFVFGRKRGRVLCGAVEI
jgi:hypothetical protein